MIRIIDLDGHLFGIESRKYSPALHREAKATPGMRWKDEYKAWCGWPDAVVACVQRLEEAGINIEGEVPYKPTELSDNDQVEKVLFSKAVKGLREYQVHGVRFLVAQAADGALLADDMGLGKTAQTLRTIQSLGRSALIVCPSFVRNVWVREAAKWLPKMPICQLHGTKPKTPDLEELRVNAPTLFLVHYDIVHAWVEPIINIARPSIAVFDECHFLMSDKSRRSLACRAIARATSYRIGLSGTPMTSRPRDLWNVVDTLSEGRFGRPFDFFLAHCTPPDAPIWMGDLSFKPIGEVRPGDTVIGWQTPPARPLKVLRGKSFNAPGYKRRKLVRTKVLAVGRRQADIVKVTLASGRVLRCTPDHLWMSGKHSCKRYPWVRAQEGRWLSHVITPPTILSEDERATAHWLGGLFDGEGSAGKTARGSFVYISQSPHHNPKVCVAIECAFEKLKIPYAVYEVKPSKLGRGANTYYLNGGRQTALDFLTWCRPVKSERIVERILGSKIRTPDAIVSVEPDGFGEVVSLTTETGNYIVYGYASKNCDAHKETVTTRAGDRIVWNMTGASRLDELKQRLDYFMLRRTKSDVELELPQRTRQVVEVEIKRECRTPIGSALKSDKLLREALALAADGKLPKAVELIMNHVESGSKVVCFSHRKAIAELMATGLRANGIIAKIITGDVPQKRRIEIVDEQPTVLCATMDSTQVGIDLTFADIAVFVELDWVPSKLAQCEARLHRFGQKRPVLIQYVIALSTADEVIADAVVAKLDVFSSGIGKLDDGLRETLSGSVEINSVDQLKKLYEKLKEPSNGNRPKTHT